MKYLPQTCVYSFWWFFPMIHSRTCIHIYMYGIFTAQVSLGVSYLFFIADVVISCTHHCKHVIKLHPFVFHGIPLTHCIPYIQKQILSSRHILNHHTLKITHEKSHFRCFMTNYPWYIISNIYIHDIKCPTSIINQQ